TAFTVEFGGAHKKLHSAFKVVLQASHEHGGLLAQLGHGIAHAPPEELGSILSNLNDSVGPLLTPAVVESMSSSTFKPALLKKEKTAGFFIIPPTHLKAGGTSL